MNRNRIGIVLVLLAAVFFSSCAVDTVVLKPGYDFKKIHRVAVLPFRDSAYYTNSGSLVSQIFVKYLLKAGYNIIEREELDALLKEHQMTAAGIVSNPDEAKEFGKISGIDAIVTGSIPLVVHEQTLYENNYPRYIAAQVGVTCRMISVDTGEVLWAASDTYDAMNVQTAFEYLVSSLVNQLSRDTARASAKVAASGS